MKGATAPPLYISTYFFLEISRTQDSRICNALLLSWGLSNSILTKLFYFSFCADADISGGASAQRGIKRGRFFPIYYNFNFRFVACMRAMGVSYNKFI